MPLITAHKPQSWQQLEEVVAAILGECGMNAKRDVTIKLPRGTVDVDVMAHEAVDGITHRIVCECKNWQANIPKEVVHAFRTVMQETGAHRGHIISSQGFQAGAFEAAESTNIDLLTFEAFQELYFNKWISKRIWAIEEEISDFNTYYEPLGPPGYGKLKDKAERAAYDAVFDKYQFAGFMLMPFSPYLRMMGPQPYPAMPFDVSALEKSGVSVPQDIKAANGYREFLELLAGYARVGLAELRHVNPVTRGKNPDRASQD